MKFYLSLGSSKSLLNYVPHYNSKVHCQVIGNDVIEDEDQMPFMDGYLIDSDSGKQTDYNIILYLLS